MTEETTTITQHWLGLAPYVLVQLKPSSDGSGDPALHVEFGGGCDDPVMMALLIVSESDPEKNPVAQMLRDVYRETGSTSTGSGVVEKIAGEFNPDWLDFITN